MNKLVRDKIPEIIEKQGGSAQTKILSDREFLTQLEIKLDEEVCEFHESGELEELVDIFEVLYALCDARGYSSEQLMSVYKANHESRGGFKQKIFLISKS